MQAVHPNDTAGSAHLRLCQLRLLVGRQHVALRAADGRGVVQAAAAARQPPAVPAVHHRRRLLLLRHDLLPDGFMSEAGLSRQWALRRRAAAALLLLHGRQDRVHGCRGRRLAPPILLLLLTVLWQAEHGAHNQLVFGRLSAQHGQVEQIVGQCLVVQA